MGDDNLPRDEWAAFLAWRDDYSRHSDPCEWPAWQARAALAAQAAQPPAQPNGEGARDADKWRLAIDEALITACIGTAEPGDDPRRKLADLIAWETKIALDPAVSSDAQALIERGRAEAGADAERYRWLRDDPRGRTLSVSAIEWSGDPAKADDAIDAARSC